MLHLDTAVQSVRWSPYKPDLLAVGAAEHFGVVGNGRQYIVEVCSATGDGSIKLWDINRPQNSVPVGQLTGHTKECASLDWSSTNKHELLSCGWDGSTIVWNPITGQQQLRFTLPLVPVGPNGQVRAAQIYEARWNPRRPNVFATVGADGVLRVYDTRAPQAVQGGQGGQAGMHIQAHDSECMSVDWNKYVDNVLVTGGADQSIRMWDLRAPNVPQGVLLGHRLAVKKVRWSNYTGHRLASASYDMSVKVWMWGLNGQTGEEAALHHHTEFAQSIDWSLFREGVIASGSWDKTVRVWQGPIRK